MGMLSLYHHKCGIDPQHGSTASRGREDIIQHLGLRSLDALAIEAFDLTSQHDTTVNLFITWEF